MTYDILKKPYENYLKNHHGEPFITLEEMEVAYKIRDEIRDILNGYGLSLQD